MNYLFEVSWEVCNKVSGVGNVLRSKARYVNEEFGDGYFLLGPLLDENAGFKETQESGLDEVKAAIEKIGLRCKFGRWKIKGEPRVILVDGREHYDINKVLYAYWQDFGVDSYAGKWDYIEPVLFSTACGEVIETFCATLINEGDRVLAHFHEWVTGGGLLHVRKKLPEVGTVFTAHSTMVGRTMASTGRDFYSDMESLNAIEEARTYGVSAKHSMELACAREADCFTSVSSITAEESAAILQKYPDWVVPSGIDLSDLPDYSLSRGEPKMQRAFLLQFSQKFLRRSLPPHTRLWLTSGRYEFHNKGYDILIESLAQLDKQLTEDDPPVVVFLLVAAGHRGVLESVHRRVRGTEETEEGSVGLVTHHVPDEHNDPITKTCYRLGLRNGPENKVSIVFCPAYLDGYDGIFDRPYEDLITGCDLAAFPCFYEPWGLTPLEAIARAVHMVTTDLSGFGLW